MPSNPVEFVERYGSDQFGTVITATPEEAEQLARNFKKRYRVLYGPATLYTWRYIPRPKRGGTYYYCEHPVPVRLPKYDRIGRRTGRYYESTRPCGHRVRRLKTYKRHWIRKHEGSLDSSPASAVD